METNDTQSVGTPASPHFDEYRRRTGFEPREPDLTNQDHPDEVTDLCNNSEVFSLQEPPDNAVNFATADPESDVPDQWLTADEEAKYLYVIQTEDVKVAQEYGNLGRSTQRKRLSHTNLSGLEPAHSGGELWFKSATEIYINGGSSRFPPRSSAELEAIAEGFQKAGFRVCSFGWEGDPETGRPRRTLRRADIIWM